MKMYIHWIDSNTFSITEAKHISAIPHASETNLRHPFHEKCEKTNDKIN
jgi:hypothetical protein